MDTGGNHEVDCPNHVMIETLTMSEQAYKQLTGYMDYKGEVVISAGSAALAVFLATTNLVSDPEDLTTANWEERELAEMGMDEYSKMLKKEDEA